MVRRSIDLKTTLLHGGNAQGALPGNKHKPTISRQRRFAAAGRL
jgi:hypothetical protein